jgi:hypothetical protein
LRRGKEEVAVALGVDGDESEFEETVASMGEVEVQVPSLEGEERTPESATIT